jgi:ATP-dependent Lon protease
MFSKGYGFVVDYLAEILRNLRNHDYSHLYREHFELFEDISTRDRTGIEKTFSGLMKILFPHQEATREELEEVLRFAIEGRKRIKDQLLRIDTTYATVNFGYRDTDGRKFEVRALEEELYPRQYSGPDRVVTTNEFVRAPIFEQITPMQSGNDSGNGLVKEQHLTFQENHRGISYAALFGPYLAGARRIVITDPYIRLFYQARNLMELLETIAEKKPDDDEVEVHLLTMKDALKEEQQTDYLTQMQTACLAIGIHFTWEFDDTNTIHARHIVTDHGWKILLDRGLDIFQPYDMNDAFAFPNRLQQYRTCKAFAVTFLRIDASE